MHDFMQVSSKLNGEFFFFFLAYYAYHPNLLLLEGQFKTEVVTACSHIAATDQFFPGYSNTG